jgi:tetratricopeptide (TPR) repeat protein
MPRTGVFDVEAVLVHDHFIRRRPGDHEPAEGLRRLAAPDGAWRRFAWPDVPAPEHSRDPGLRLMACYSNGFSRLALELLDAEPGAASRALPDYHHARGALLEEEGRLADAERAYRKALELDPGYGPSGVNLGAVLARLHRPKEALAVLDEHLARHPASNGGLRNRALVRLDLGDTLGLVEDLEAALELYPTAAQARTLADLWRQLGDPDKARAFLERAEALAAGREP